MSSNRLHRNRLSLGLIEEVEEFCYGGAIATLHVKRMNCSEKLRLMLTLALSKVAAVLIYKIAFAALSDYNA